MKRTLIGAIVALMLGATAAAAQQPHGQPGDSAPAMGAAGGMSMMMMDSLSNRLDSLVARMNRASGNKKVDAMAAVISELVSQRKAMMERMHRMMEGDRMMGMMGKPASKTDSASPAPADSADHAAHHPQN